MNINNYEKFLWKKKNQDICYMAKPPTGRYSNFSIYINF